MSNDSKIQFLPNNHAGQRIGEEARESLITAQSEIVENEFPDAHEFALRVCDDLKLDLSLPNDLQEQTVTNIADLPFSDLVEFWTSILSNNELPSSSIANHASNLAHRSQLVRAFTNPEGAIDWAMEKVIAVTESFPKEAADIECGRNPGDVLDPYILTATQFLLYEGDFEEAIGATVAHKALMILEGLMGHLHEEVIGQMRGNVKNPEPRGENQELFDPELNPFPGADIVQPPSAEGEALKIHQVKSKTGTLNSSGGARLAEQMRQLRMRYQGAEIYAHSLVGNTLKGHRSMGGMRRVEPTLIITVGDVAFQILTRSPNGAELLIRLYQNAFQMSAKQTGYGIEDMAQTISQAFQERADAAGEGYLELLLHNATRGELSQQDSRTYSAKHTS